LSVKVGKNVRGKRKGRDQEGKDERAPSNRLSVRSAVI